MYQTWFARTACRSPDTENLLLRPADRLNTSNPQRIWLSMLFASFPYLLAFLPVTVLGTIGLRRLLGPRAAQLWVLAASMFFYAFSHPLNLIFLFGSILANWMLARSIARAAQPAGKRILIAALTLNVVFLAWFKYAGLAGSAFPLGLSFFTITQIMYLVDCYETLVDPGSLLDHASFVCFFPYLISGPLGKADRMRRQFPHLGGSPGRRAELLARGLFLFALGLFKKTVFADAFGQVVRFGASTARHTSALEGWVFALAYAMQVYFDFSGYSDMAIGSALMLGVEIPRNFDRPFSATSIIEYWQRWHISLTAFLTGYLFTPILRSFKRPGIFAACFATFAAMLISGLWHGAGWQFVVWGALHGLFLVINQLWRRQRRVRLPAIVSWALTFAAVIVAFVYFGASDVSAGTASVLNLFNPHHALATANLRRLDFQIDGFGLRFAALPLVAGVAIALFGPSSEQRAREFQPVARNCVYAVACACVALILMNSSTSVPFVYFNF